MFNPYGTVNSEMANETVALFEIRSPLIDISAGITTLPLFVDMEFDVGIYSIDLLYQATATGTAGELDIGTTADADAIVDGYATSNSALVGTSAHIGPHAAPSSNNAQSSLDGLDEFASTLKTYNPKHNGHPVLTAGTVLTATTIGTPTNAGDFFICIKMWRLQPGT